MNLVEIRQKYIDVGYDLLDASAKVCQDIILSKIANSIFNKNITIKGGVVMHSISNDRRRATRDMDLDFIRYSLSDESIYSFISKLNSCDDGIKIEIIDEIVPLHHQDYDGKRVFVRLIDENDFDIKIKLDIGVNKNLEMAQDEYCFNLDVINKSAVLFINSKEQIFTEKLKSLLKFGFSSTRFKDIFDFYYLINYGNLDKDKLLACMEILVFSDSTMRENDIKAVVRRVKIVLNSKMYIRNLKDANNNWLEIPIDEVIISIFNFFEILETVEV